jgi:hypothetical protein
MKRSLVYLLLICVIHISSRAGKDAFGVTDSSGSDDGVTDSSDADDAGRCSVLLSNYLVYITMRRSNHYSTTMYAGRHVHYKAKTAKPSAGCKRKSSGTVEKSWNLEFKNKPCGCSARRGDSISCLTYFIEAGFDAYSSWRSHWDDMHKLDQDRAVTSL